MNKAFIILLLVVASLAGTCYLMYQHIAALEKEKEKYKGNTISLLSDIKQIRIDSTTMAVDVKELRLTLDELKEYRAEDLEQIQKLNVRIKSLQSMAKHSLVVSAPIQAEVKDSIIVRDTVKIQLQTISMDTPHLSVNGIIENNKLEGSIHLPVNLHQAIWVEHRHRFLWWRWGIKAIHQTISSDNPHVKISYSELIRIEK